MRRLLFLTLCMSLGPLGCEEKSAPTPKPAPPEKTAEKTLAKVEKKVEKERKRRGLKNYEGPEPCEIITDEMVRKVFSVPEGTALEKRPGRMSPICTFRWDKPNKEEIQEEIQKKQQEMIKEMAKRMQKKGSKNTAQTMLDAALDMPSTQNEVSVNFAPTRYESPEQARAGFESAMKVLARGIEQNVETNNSDEKVRLQMDSENIDGVEDMAAWVPKLRQLGVVSGKHVFYIVVQVDKDPAKNLEKAKTFAPVVARAL